MMVNAHSAPGPGELRCEFFASAASESMYYN